MDVHQQVGTQYAEAKRGEFSSSAAAAAASTRDITIASAHMQRAHEELLICPDGGMKTSIVGHPLFEQLLAAHVGCLRGTAMTHQLEQQQQQPMQMIIDSALANRHLVAAKYLALYLSHSHESNSYVAAAVDTEELTHFMVNYILLLQSFKGHLTQANSEAILACQEIQQAFFNLTGVSFPTSSYSWSSEISAMDEEQEKNYDAEDGLGLLGTNLQRTLREHVRRELKKELKKDYQSKLGEVHCEILRKRRTGKLPEDTTHLLKDWWLSHAKWPYPTEEDKAQLMEETGLELKQINNWFINQRKRNWQAEKINCEQKPMVATLSNPIGTALSLNVDEEDYVHEY